MDDILEGFLLIFLIKIAGYIKNPNRKSGFIISIAKVHGE